MQKIIEKLKFVDDRLEYMQPDPQSLSRTTLAEVIGELQQLLNKHDVSGSLPLADVNWLHLGTTDEYSALKKRIAHICHVVTEACCIDEICINDIVVTFRQFGYEVVKRQ